MEAELAKIKSKWYRPPSLRYIMTKHERKRIEQEYKEWLAQSRNKLERKEDERRKTRA